MLLAYSGWEAIYWNMNNFSVAISLKKMPLPPQKPLVVGILLYRGETSWASPAHMMTGSVCMGLLQVFTDALVSWEPWPLTCFWFRLAFVLFSQNNRLSLWFLHSLHALLSFHSAPQNFCVSATQISSSGLDPPWPVMRLCIKCHA